MVNIWRGCYRDVETDDFWECIKHINESRAKKIFDILRFKIGTEGYLRLKWIKNLAQLEVDNFTKVQPLIPLNVPERTYIWEDWKIHQTLVKDSDGKISLPIKEFSKSTNIPKEFFTKIQECLDKLMENKIFFYRISDKNILVQETPQGLNPIFIDFKSVGKKAYPLQVWLHFNFQQRNKVKRKFNKLRDSYSTSI